MPPRGVRVFPSHHPSGAWTLDRERWRHLPQASLCSSARVTCRKGQDTLALSFRDMWSGSRSLAGDRGRGLGTGSGVFPQTGCSAEQGRMKQQPWGLCWRARASVVSSGAWASSAESGGRSRVPAASVAGAAAGPSRQIAPLLWLAFWLKVHLDLNLA